MMRKVFFLLLIAMAVLPLSLSAQKATQPSSDKPQTIYIFGVSQNLSDSLVYISEITELSARHLLDKKRFLINREAYSSQFSDYLAEKLGSKHQTAAVFFAWSKNKAQSQRLQVKKKVMTQKNPISRVAIKDIVSQDFQFRLLETGAENAR